MALRLNERTLAVDTIIGEGEAQAVVEGTVSLPDAQPDIDRALRVRAVPVVRSVRASDDQVTVEGVVRLDALYASQFEQPKAAQRAANDEDDPFAEEAPEFYERLVGVDWGEALPFSQVIEVLGAGAETASQASVRVEAVEYEVGADQRTLAVDVVLALTGKAVRTESLQAAVGVHGDRQVQTKARELTVQSRLGRATADVRATGAITLPEGAADADLVWSELTASVDHVHLDGSVALVRGRLQGDLIYTSGPIREPFRVGVYDEVPFEASLSLGRDCSGAAATARASVCGVKWRLAQDDENRPALRLDVGVQIEASALLTQTANVLTELVAPADTGVVATRVTDVELTETIGTESQTISAAQPLELSSEYLPIERLLSGAATATIDDVHVLGDKVAVEGYLDVAVIYVGRGAPGEGDLPQAAEWPQAINFEAEIDLDGAEPGMQRDVQVRVNDVQFDLRNRETVDVSAKLTATVAVSRSAAAQIVVEAVEVPAPAPDAPSYTFLVVQKGDTLWSIAHRFHTDEAAIAAANPERALDAPLAVGEKLCIPKVRIEPVAV
ncbi:MAG TPA: SPOCS domain-containing protein [Limnochordia bacterium]|nr:SPOCS domain-containing protein [Limnochordia bacterium]